MVYLCVCFGSMFTVLVQRYSKLHSAEALIVVNWPMRECQLCHLQVPCRSPRSPAEQMGRKEGEQDDSRQDKGRGDPASQRVELPQGSAGPGAL